jgi:hypothetical protein
MPDDVRRASAGPPIDATTTAATVLPGEPLERIAGPVGVLTSLRATGTG